MLSLYFSIILCHMLSCVFDNLLTMNVWWWWWWWWLSMTLSDLWPGFQGHDILKLNIGKTTRLKDKVTIAQEETIPNIWNGTIFGDLDCPLNASRGFVSISWASCFCFTADVETTPSPTIVEAEASTTAVAAISSRPTFYCSVCVTRSGW